MKMIMATIIAAVYLALIFGGGAYLFSRIDKETCIAKGAIMQRDVSWQWQTGCMIKTKTKFYLNHQDAWVPLNNIIINE